MKTPWNYEVLPGSEREEVPGARAIGRPRRNRLLEVTLLLRPPPGAPAASAALAEIEARPPRERPHMTRAQYAEAHSADAADVREVRRFARRNGLHVVEVDQAARTVELRGTVAALSAAFNVELQLYEHPFVRRLGESVVFVGRTGPVMIPIALKDIVQGVFGLDERPAAKPRLRRRRALGGGWRQASAAHAPPEVASLYDFPTDLDGTGQCIGIIELGGGFRARDLRRYFRELGVPQPEVIAVSVAGGHNAPTGNVNGPDTEVMLDIEVAGSVAPGASIVVYFAPNTDRGFLQAVKRAVHDSTNQPSVISISWGAPEGAWTAQALTAMDQAFQAAALMGVTICCASGDGGSSDGVRGSTANVDFPASSPFALGCGGTHLEGSAATITQETVWNGGPLGGATGGGISDFFDVPSWQVGIDLPASANQTGRVGRGVPDVAGNADPVTGYQIRVDGRDVIVGGTSAVAPLWAGLIALANQQLETPVGYLNPLLYQQIAGTAGVFRDIVGGDNDNTSRVGGYPADAGWDACTGWGSPDGTQFVEALSALDSTDAPDAPDAPAAAPSKRSTRGSRGSRGSRAARSRTKGASAKGASAKGATSAADRVRKTSR